jgi:uncharacterized RmlC-like cupin family protein
MGNRQGTAVAAGPERREADAPQQDHAGLDHAGLDHAGLDHAGLDHAGLDHAGLDHAGPEQPRLERFQPEPFGQRGGTCVVIRPDAVPDEHQGITLATGITRDTAGSKALCMNLVMLPPGTRGTPHFHSGHESAIWIAMGEAEVWHGPGLCGRTVVHPGDFLYIPAGIPHLPVNRSETEMMVAVVARTDPTDRESVVVFDLPPHLDGLFAVPVAAAL